MKKILVIEDEPMILENALEMLQLEQFDSIGAANGALGLQLAYEQLPDLILCDILMPEMDGYAVLEKLRQNPQTAAIPIIFMSAMIEPQTQKDTDTHHFLPKPFRMDHLIKAIREYLPSEPSS